VPAALPTSCEDVFAMARDKFEDLIRYLQSAASRAATHSDLERTLKDQGLELLRLLYQAHLDDRGPGAAAGSVQGADGVEREQERLHERGLSTLFGEVRVRRMGYGAEGVDSLHPLDAELNLPQEEYSLGLRRKAAEQAATVSFDETVSYLGRETGKAVGKRQVEQLVQRAAQDFDAFYARRTPEAEAKTGPLLVISSDGKGVVVLPRDLREPTRKKAQEQTHKLDKRLSKGEKRHAKRMATVATVYTVAPHVRKPEDVVRTLAPQREKEQTPAPRPENKRVWASLQQTPEQVLEEAFREGRRRDPERQKTWVALVDGNIPQLEILKRLARRHEVRLTIVLDIMHVAEYLWSASLAFHDEASAEREEWVSRRLLAVLEGKSSHVAAGMRRSATLRGLSAAKREAVDVSANYLLSYKPYLRYQRYLARGFPIATGVIEGACRHLVCDRMDGGARWSLQGAEAVLRLRALRSSADFDEYWPFHESREYQRNHVAHYKGGKVVPVQGRKPPPLRRIK
jgi:hypothetical protein